MNALAARLGHELPRKPRRKRHQVNRRAYTPDANVTTATLVLPFALPSRNDDEHAHWATRRRNHRAVYDAVAWHVKAANFRAPMCPVAITYTVFCKRKRDAGNINEKAATDALVAAGVLPDDNLDYVQSVKLAAVIGTPERTEVLIERIAE